MHKRQTHVYTHLLHLSHIKESSSDLVRWTGSGTRRPSAIASPAPVHASVQVPHASPGRRAAWNAAGRTELHPSDARTRVRACARAHVVWLAVGDVCWSGPSPLAPGDASSLLFLVVRPGATSSVLAPRTPRLLVASCSREKFCFLTSPRSHLFTWPLLQTSLQRNTSKWPSLWCSFRLSALGTMK